jgi:hypothetical protein
VIRLAAFSLTYAKIKSTSVGVQVFEFTWQSLQTFAKVFPSMSFRPPVNCKNKDLSGSSEVG